MPKAPITEKHDDNAVWESLPELEKPIFRIDEKPERLWESLLYGWQHTLVDISPFVLPLAVAGAIGMSLGEKAQFINFCLFAMGIATLLQTTIGNRLPIIQGPSATLTGTLAPIAGQLGAAAMWGGIFIGGILEMFIGASRILKYLRKLFPPVVSGVVIVCIGLSLGQVAVRLMIGDGSGTNFLFGIGVILVIFFLQLKCRNLWNGILSRGAVFFAIWIVGLLIAGIFGQVNWQVVAEKPWFELPQFFPYGGPGFGWEFMIPAILAIIAGYMGSMVESLGDYAATCAVAGEKYTVSHMNKGIFAEGLGSVVAAAFGGLPCTSYTQNIGIIATTRVASRFVVQIAAVVLLLYGLCPKFGALLVAMPRSVLGGVFILVCGMIVISGIRLLQVAPDTTGNQFVAGLTLIISIGVPIYAKFGLGDAWLNEISLTLKLLLTNTVVLAVLVAIVLNVILNIILQDSPEKG